MNQSLRSLYDLLMPLPIPAEYLPLDRPEPFLDFAPGDDVVIRARHANYVGIVLDVDAYENRVKVRYFDPNLGKHQTRRWLAGYVHLQGDGR